MTTRQDWEFVEPMTEPDDGAWIAASADPRPAQQAPAAAPTTPAHPDTSTHGAAPTQERTAPTEDRPAAAPVSPAATPAPPAAAPVAPAAAPAPPAAAPAPKPADGEIGPTGRPLRTIPEPAALSSHGPARVIAMCNQKGGVGKTTSTINLGAALAGFGRRVLLVDLDPQGALSAGLGVPSHELDRTIYNLMLEKTTAISDVLVSTDVENLDLIPANIDLSAAEVQLINEVGREQTLARALRPVLHAYDYVLIDCQPSLGLLTVNALACSHGVIMPVAAEFFSLRGVALLVDTVEKVQERINPELTIDGVLVTMFDGRTVHARDVVAMLVQRFGDQVFDAVIARTVKFPETTVAGEPITSYAPTSPAAEAYRALAREVIAR
ncbi:ParA family protein [Nakamurella lactea]|uniref:ParA family protein n=1 Tax=Nakamurella lactea TaxID=459515 RepID=UPI0004105623|nr:ParA family protein [Nakamurella lactea]